MFNNVLSIISVYGIRDCCNQIKYDYGRLVGISYLDHSENDMKYHYGATYDSWNRVRTMTYPDGEVVTYHYNAAGQVESLTSNKLGKNETLIEKIGYDKDGHTVYTKLGNGTESRYTYDKQRERLQEMTLSSAGNTVMQNKYKYDLVDNILGITNNADPQEIGNKNKAKLGGTFKHSYAYDDLNRLVYASGKAKQASYSMQMTFGRMSEPLTKVQKVDSTKTAQSYDFTYKYEDSNHPTAPTQIGHEHYTYDANGNPTLVENDSLGTERRMYWDEDNRLMVLSDNGKTNRYTYNAAGERIIKSHGDLEGVYINGAPQGITFHETEDYTIYPAPMITVTKNRFTKHYFIGDKRVASKLGVGKFSNVYGISGNNVTAGQKDYAARMLQIEKQRGEYYRSLGTPPGVPTMKGATADPDNTGRGYNDIIGDLGDHSVPEGWGQRPKFNDKGDVPGPPIQWQKPEDPDNAQPGYGYVPTDTTNTEEIFFYHSDHLGSTSYITDAKANITQFDAYLPYGELLVDEHSSSEDMPYKFNGKELDQETGLYYYGARYYDPRVSLWMSIDPMYEKYPNFSSYIYCINNPVKLIDPDGRQIQEPDSWKTISPVIPKEKFIGWGDPSVKDNYNCFALSKKQLNVMGYTVGGASDPSNLYTYNENRGVNRVDTHKAISYIESALNQGEPVLIGVDTHAGSPNPDKTTDHYLVVVGMGHDKKGNYLQVYDNATSNTKDGTSPENKLYYDSKTGKISGRIPNSYSRDSQKPYTVSQVRTSKALKRKKTRK